MSPISLLIPMLLLLGAALIFYVTLAAALQRRLHRRLESALLEITATFQSLGNNFDEIHRQLINASSVREQHSQKMGSNQVWFE